MKEPFLKLKGERLSRCKCGSTWIHICPNCHEYTQTWKWVSFDKQEPPLKQRILVAKDHSQTGCESEITIDSYHGEWEYSRNRVGRITHWMPLPDAPKEF